MSEFELLECPWYV